LCNDDVDGLGLTIHVAHEHDMRYESNHGKNTNRR
jgi:hypothetical protein